MRTPHPTKGTPSWSRDVWWRHFRWKGTTGADNTNLPVAHERTPPFQWNSFGVTWRLMTSLSVKRPTGADIAQLPVAHAHTLPREPLRGHVTFDDVTSGSHVGQAQWYILYYYYSKKKALEPVAHAHAITFGHVTSSSRHVISGDVISGHGRFRWRHFR